jgi:hypothetical protein
MLCGFFAVTIWACAIPAKAKDAASAIIMFRIMLIPPVEAPIWLSDRASRAKPHLGYIKSVVAALAKGKLLP